MRKYYFFLFCLFLWNISPIYGTTKTDNHRQTDWTLIIEAIIQVESSGNEKAVSKDGKCVGAMQIQKIVVDDCNEYLKLKKSTKRFTYDDRYDREKSIEMFYLIQERYNKTNDIEKGIRIWNGGPFGYKYNSTIPYYNKVLNKLKETND